MVLQGIRTNIANEPYIFVIFQGGVPLWIRAWILAVCYIFHKHFLTLKIEFGCRIVRHFIWFFTICQRRRLGGFGLQRAYIFETISFAFRFAVLNRLVLVSCVCTLNDRHCVLLFDSYEIHLIFHNLWGSHFGPIKNTA